MEGVGVGLVGGWRGSRRLWKGGRCQWAGVIWRLVMMMMALVIQGFKMSARYMRRFVKQAEVFGSLRCILLQTTNLIQRRANTKTTKALNGKLKNILIEMCYEVLCP